MNACGTHCCCHSHRRRRGRRHLPTVWKKTRRTAAEMLRPMLLLLQLLLLMITTTNTKAVALSARVGESFVPPCRLLLPFSPESAPRRRRGDLRVFSSSPSSSSSSPLGSPESSLSSRTEDYGINSRCPSSRRRRDLLKAKSVAALFWGAASSWISSPTPAAAAAAESNEDETTFPVAAAAGDLGDRRSTVPAFRTRAYGREEYTNSITASRDTNVSPREAYDVMRQRVPVNDRTGSRERRALDVGAGAGVSTAVLYGEMGYRCVDAVDWSGEAWRGNVAEPIPDTVRFYPMDDDQFFRSEARPKSYHVIVYNFAVNADKAVRVARRYLVDEGDGGDEPRTGDGGLLLAPVNDRDDYWYKQTYWVINSKGQILWKSQPEVGAWSVQFQPDVTSETCTGIWCGGVNGYQPARTSR